MAEEGDIEVKSFKVTLSAWPKTGIQVCSLFIVTVFFGWIIYLLAKSDLSRKDVVEAFRVYYARPGAEIEASKTKFYRIGFWTPSPETQSDLVAAFPNGIPAGKQLETNCNE